MARIRWNVKVLGGLAALMLFLVACNQAAPPDAGTLESQSVGERYIVVLAEQADADFPGRGQSIAADVARGYGLQATHTYGAAIVGFAARIPDGRLAQLQRDARVKYVEPDDPVQLYGQTMPTGIPRTFATTNTKLDIDGTDDFRVDVDVAVIDTGVDYEHPDLNVVGGVDCTQASGGGPPWARTYSCSSGGDDDHYHGTHVAGTIGAIDNGEGVVGVAPGARIWAVKVLDSSGSGYEGGIVAGIDWVAANADTIEVANMSLGGSGFSRAEYDAIEGARTVGVAFAVAAGNSNANASNYSPGGFDNVLSVSALADFDGAPGGIGSPTCRADQDDTLADFSNWGGAVDIAAPGVCIRSTYPVERGSYGTISGTSMASPHVAGALALLASAKNPNTSTDVQNLYNEVTNSGNFNWTDDSGDGILEPLLDVSSTTAFAPVLVAGSGGGGVAEDAAPSTSITNPTDSAFFASGASISFAGSATDTEDGDLTASLVWTSDVDGQFGTGGSFSSTLSDGTHIVTASVTDSVGQTASSTVSVKVGDTSSAISLTVTTSKVKGVKIADLTWSGAPSANVDIYRSGLFLVATKNDGAYTDNTGEKGGGSYSYQVCEAGTSTCSDAVTVSF